MNRKFAGFGIAGVVLYIGFGSAFDTAQAACRQMLAPNSWQSITVCDGNRGSNYSGAISAGVAAAGIALELMPGVLNSLGEVTSGVGDITNGASEPLQNFLSSTNRNTGGQNDGTLNPFGLFNQQPETAAPANKKKNAKQEEEAPSLFGFLTPQVNTPTVNTRTPNVNAPDAPTVNTPFPNIFAPQVNAPTPRTNRPNVNARTPNVNAPHISSAQPQ
jgi:hypothetical protein